MKSEFTDKADHIAISPIVVDVEENRIAGRWIHIARMNVKGAAGEVDVRSRLRREIDTPSLLLVNGVTAKLESDQVVAGRNPRITSSVTKDCLRVEVEFFVDT